MVGAVRASLRLGLVGRRSEVLTITQVADLADIGALARRRVPWRYSCLL